MTIPYSNGWSAYVDGKKAEMIKTNLMYSGLILSPGYHEIELVYHTPGLRIGFMISLIGVSVTIFLYVLQHHRQKRIPDLSKQ